MTELEVRFSNMVLQDLARLRSAAPSSDDLVRGLLEKISGEAYYPKPRVPLCYEDGYTGYFSTTYKGYIAFYRVEDGFLYVDRILSEDSSILRVLK